MRIPLAKKTIVLHDGKSLGKQRVEAEVSVHLLIGLAYFNLSLRGVNFTINWTPLNAILNLLEQASVDEHVRDMERT
jgi:hypothetical protein